MLEKDLQNGDAVVGELGNLLVPARDGVGRRVAVRVVVESKEVAASRVVTAVHVVSHLVTVGLDVGSRVADGDLAEPASVHVRLDVTGDGLDVGRAVGGLVVVDDLVGREEQQGVVVLCKHLDGSEDALQIHLVVRLLGVGSVDGVLGGVEVERKVDTGVGQEAHAGVVVGAVVDSVDTDSVDSKLLELGNVTLASLFIGNGVLGIRCATRLVVYATDVETLVASKEG